MPITADVGGRAHRVELVIERSDSISLELQVQEPDNILQKVLQPVRRRGLPRHPVDVTRIILHDPAQLELLVLPKVQLFRT